MRTVAKVPEEAQFVSDSQEVNSIKEYLGKKANKFDSFFVIVGDGDYEAVWGMMGIVPLLTKNLTKLA
jgi:hypothetical protein